MTTKFCLFKVALILSMLFAFQQADAKASCRSGKSSFYGVNGRKEHLNKRTANGASASNLGRVRTAASWIYPLGSFVNVLYGGRSIRVKITDRGPAKRLGRIIDLSYGAAKALGAGFINQGVSKVQVCSGSSNQRRAEADGTDEEQPQIAGQYPSEPVG
jgi:rare lipoprotein A